MKGLVQRLRDGQITLLESPAPIVQAGQVLIQTQASVVSAGTETMLLQFGKSNWLQKARQQPAQVRQVFDKVRKDGLLPTWKAVKSKLDTPVPMGYCNAGIVLEVGRGVSGISIGDRVASNGPHAGVVSVGAHLVATLPEAVSFEEGAFAPLAAIALHGVRLAQPTLGEQFVVIGLGLVGFMAAQLLRQNGCRVLGIDTNPRARARASAAGIEVLDGHADPDAQVRAHTQGQGVDGVLIATNTQDAAPLTLAVALARTRGRLVLIGTAAVGFDRTALFRKELSFVVSSSYGPGRYDPSYEVHGHDYPLPYVRWTAGRNFEAVLQSMAVGALQVQPLIGARWPVEAFEKAYSGTEPFFGTAVFSYGETSVSKTAFPERTIDRTVPSGTAIGIIGAGQFTQAILLPLMQQLQLPVRSICSANGISAGIAARRFNIPELAAEVTEILADDRIGTVVIATRHHQHAPMVTEAMRSGKHVFVEKPLALSETELQAVTEAYQTSGMILTVGFNRRFAPLMHQLKAAFPAAPDMHLTYTVNAGVLPEGHWLSDAAIGGGRLLGEGCHFIDSCLYLAGSTVKQVFCSGSASGFTVILTFRNGATATIHYVSSGASRYPKERIELHSMGSSAVLSNWRTLEIFRNGGTKTVRSRQDKGHSALLQAHWAAVNGQQEAPIPFPDLAATTKATLAAAESLQTGLVVLL
ncbi:MAG: dehydrogenase [Sphingobacteriales bacterium]|nr:MAG: dehydrogenase [Sphingobacteriales bacterium]